MNFTQNYQSRVPVPRRRGGCVSSTIFYLGKATTLVFYGQHFSKLSEIHSRKPGTRPPSLPGYPACTGQQQGRSFTCFLFLAPPLRPGYGKLSGTRSPPTGIREEGLWRLSIAGFYIATACTVFYRIRSKLQRQTSYTPHAPNHTTKKWRSRRSD